MNYVIVGNSAGGIAAVEAIRRHDKENEITVISDESHLNYSRPLISYLLAKKIDLSRMAYRGKDFYEQARVRLLLGKEAVNLDLEKKRIVLQNGEAISFHKLLIATGGRPIIPNLKGSHLQGVFTFTRLSDALRMEKYIRANKIKEAVVIGGGLIGLKATEALIELGIKVTIVELADRVLSATFDDKASSLVRKGLERIGCRLITNNSVAEIRGKEEKAKEVVLEDGKKLDVGLVVIAIGTRPNTTLTANTSLKTDKGILVDRFMQTNIKDIYAAGDCCQAKDFLLNTNRPIAIWPVAVKQGRVAGYNMAGVKKEYPGSFVMNSVELAGIPTISMGETSPQGEGYEVLVYFDEEKFLYRKIVLKSNRIVGAIFVGDIERAGIYTGLIKDRVDTASFREHLLKKEFGLISLPKEYRKHLVTGEGMEV